jgi:hypothetical protein
MIGDKLAAVAKQAMRNGDNLLATSLLNMASVYLYGREDLLKLIAKSTYSTLEIAKEERDYRGGVTPVGNIEGDKIEDALTTAYEYATAADEEHVAGIVSFVQSLRSIKRQDLIEQLYDVAESLSSPAIGRESRKNIVIMEAHDDDGPTS